MRWVATVRIGEAQSAAAPDAHVASQPIDTAGRFHFLNGVRCARFAERDQRTGRQVVPAQGAAEGSGHFFSWLNAMFSGQ